MWRCSVEPAAVNSHTRRRGAASHEARGLNAALCAPPSLLMLFLSFVGYGVAPMLAPRTAAHARAAVLGPPAVVTCRSLGVAEPAAHHPDAEPNDLAFTDDAIAIGFVLGIAVFLLLAEFCEVEELAVSGEGVAPATAEAAPSSHSERCCRRRSFAEDSRAGVDSGCASLGQRGRGRHKNDRPPLRKGSKLARRRWRSRPP